MCVCVYTVYTEVKCVERINMGGLEVAARISNGHVERVKAHNTCT